MPTVRYRPELVHTLFCFLFIYFSGECPGRFCFRAMAFHKSLGAEALHPSKGPAETHVQTLDVAIMHLQGQ